jgi:hypothetical protein
VGEGRVKSVRRGRRGLLYRRGGGSPKGGRRLLGDIHLLFMVVTPIINMM